MNDFAAAKGDTNKQSTAISVVVLGQRMIRYTGGRCRAMDSEVAGLRCKMGGTDEAALQPEW